MWAPERRQRAYPAPTLVIDLLQVLLAVGAHWPFILAGLGELDLVGHKLKRITLEPTVFHRWRSRHYKPDLGLDNCIRGLSAAGFRLLDRGAQWDLSPLGDRFASHISVWVADSALRGPYFGTATSSSFPSISSFPSDRIDRRTLERWRQWWLDTFVRCSFWKKARARFMPLVCDKGAAQLLVRRFRNRCP
jgi:hypothetical protein